MRTSGPPRQIGIILTGHFPAPAKRKVSRTRLNIFAAVDFRVSPPGPADNPDASAACSRVSPIAANHIFPNRREMRRAEAARENSLRHACVI
jgi:hypothetical protein